MMRGWACEQCLRRLFHGLDSADYPALGDCFMADGVWHRRGVALTGRGAILMAMRERPATYRVHHVITNCLVLDSAATILDAAFYMTAYRYAVASTVDVTPRLSEPPAFFLGTARFARDETAWRVSELTYRRVCELVTDAARAAE